MLPQGGDGAFQVYGVPKNDGGNDQIESAGAVALVLEAAVAQVALPIEEDGAGESVSGLAFVESDLHTPTKFRVFHPLQHEEGTLNAPDFTEGNVEAVLARIAREFADNV